MNKHCTKKDLILFFFSWPITFQKTIQISFWAPQSIFNNNSLTFQIIRFQPVSYYIARTFLRLKLFITGFHLLFYDFQLFICGFPLTFLLLMNYFFTFSNWPFTILGPFFTIRQPTFYYFQPAFYYILLLLL